VSAPHGERAALRRWAVLRAAAKVVSRARVYKGADPRPFRELIVGLD
jgi:hypothetical protein